MTASTLDLRSAWRDHKAASPRAHARDFAAAMGVSECTLVASLDGATRLSTDWERMIHTITGFGRVKTMTRNAEAVIEQYGAYENVEFFGPMGQTVGTAIDLRIFLSGWAHGYAVTEPGTHGVRKSLQFFDDHGVAIHKLFEEPESTTGAYDAFVGQFRADDQSVPILASSHEMPTERPDSAIDVTGLRQAWDKLQSTHDFFAMLGQFGVTRTQALRLAGPERAVPMELSVAERVLADAAATQRKIMIFVGNRGIIQIFIGTISRVARAAGWLNVLDPDFNLHLRDDQIASAWWVKKPTADGPVNSIELFNAQGDNIALLFSKRNFGEAESPDWGRFLTTLPVRHD